MHLFWIKSWKCYWILIIYGLGGLLILIITRFGNIIDKVCDYEDYFIISIKIICNFLSWLIKEYLNTTDFREVYDYNGINDNKL